MNVTIIGLGKLGAPMVAVFADRGHHVTGVDADLDVMAAFGEGRSPVEEPGVQTLLDANRDSLWVANPERACADAEIVFVVVPTPSLADGNFSIDHILDALLPLAEALRERPDYCVVAIVSTVSPGSMVRIRAYLEEQTGRRCGPDFGLCYNPEFIALGSVIHDMLHPDFVLVGESDPRAGQVLGEFYATIHDAPVCRMGFHSAEACKIALNFGLTLRIAYACTVSELCAGLPGADPWEVLRTIGLDRRIGPRYLLPGTGFGGPCFPRDTRAFAAAARSAEAQSWLAEAVDQVNDWQTERLSDLVLRHAEPGDCVGILGVAYKTGTPLTEESAGVKLAQHLVDLGRDVLAHDPLAQCAGLPCRLSRDITEVVRRCRVLVVTTPWPVYAVLVPTALYEVAESRVVIDCWNRLEGAELPAEAEFVLLGKG